jgi:serine/threonine protein kinase
LLLLDLPFYDKEKEDVRVTAKTWVGVDFDSKEVKPYWENVSSDCKDLIIRLLVKNPKKRLTIGEVLKHPWFTGKEEIPTIPLTKGLARLKAFQGKLKLLEAAKDLSCKSGTSTANGMFGFSNGMKDDNGGSDKRVEQFLASLTNGTKKKKNQDSLISLKVTTKKGNVATTTTKKNLGTTKQIDPPKIAKKAPILIRDEYDFQKVLGQGAFGLVREGIPKKGVDKSSVAIKEITRDCLSEDDDYSISSEVRILETLNQEKKKKTFIVKLLDFYIEDYYYYIFMEKVNGGELFDRLTLKKTFNEKEARDLVRTLLSGIKHCHDNNVIHRDLKPREFISLFIFSSHGSYRLYSLCHFFCRFFLSSFVSFREYSDGIKK